MIQGNFKRKHAGKQNVSTIYFDKTQSDPARIISGDVNQGVIAEILSLMRRCLGKYTDTEEMTICYLRNDNSNYYHDSSAASLKGVEGDVFVYLPEFWYKLWDKSASLRALSFSLTQVDSSWKKSPGGLVGAFFSIFGHYSDYNSVAGGSVLEEKPHTDDYPTTTRGEGYKILQYNTGCTLAFLFYAKYGNTGLLKVFGQINPSTTTGVTANLGNTDGLSAEGVLSFQGIEDFCSRYEKINGVNDIQVNKDSSIVTYDLGNRTVDVPGETLFDSNGGQIYGYAKSIAAMEQSDYIDIVKSENGGTPDTYFCETKTQILYFDTWGGGCVASGGYDGNSASFPHRLNFFGSIIEQPDVTAFKTIPITNPSVTI
jgi:hypothetical protein